MSYTGIEFKIVFYRIILWFFIDKLIWVLELSISTKFICIEIIIINPWVHRSLYRREIRTWISQLGASAVDKSVAY